MDALTLYTNPQSRGRTSRWMLEETGQPYTAVSLDYGPAMKTPAFLALNPMGKVPCLTHGKHVVTEGGAICTYLADRFPASGLMPADRASFYRWMFFAAGPLEQAVTNRALGVEVPADKRGFVGYGHYDLVISTLTDHLAKTPYFCGDTFSAADVYAGSAIGFGLHFNSLPAVPVFVDYWARISDRPAHQRASAADDALIEE